MAKFLAMIGSWQDFPAGLFRARVSQRKMHSNNRMDFAVRHRGRYSLKLPESLRLTAPRAFLLENVKSRVSHNRGKTFELIRRALVEELGYHIHWKVLGACSWVPQDQERIFIVVFRELNDFAFEDFGIPSDNPTIQSVIAP